VGTTALPITAVTRTVLVLIDDTVGQPNSAEMVPKVRPGHHQRGVHAFRRAKPNARVSGHMPTNLVTILTAKDADQAVAAITVSNLTSEPA
jgi:hypothetical protein